MNVEEGLVLWTKVLTNGRQCSPSQAVLLELQEYTSLSLDEVKAAAAAAPSVTRATWDAADRSTPEGLRAFYQSLTNWVFGTLSYHARQAEGENTPLPVVAAAALSGRAAGDHLDFGSGVATASLMFAELGWRISIADVSKPLLDFAAWRFQTRKIEARVIDLNAKALPASSYDLITAFNTMAHVPDPAATFAELRTALRSGGLLVFDVDSRPRGAGRDDWHLYENDYEIIRLVRRTGFRHRPRAWPLYIFERAELGWGERAVVTLSDVLRYNGPATWVIEKARRLRARMTRA